MDDLTRAVLRVAEGEPISVGLAAAAAPIEGVIGIAASRMTADHAVLHCGTAGVEDDLVRLLEADYMVPETNPVVAHLRSAPAERLVHAGTFTPWDQFLRSPVYTDYSIRARSHHTGAFLASVDGGIYLGTPGVELGMDWPGQTEVRQMEEAMRAVFRAHASHLRAALSETADDTLHVSGVLMTEDLQFVRLTPRQGEAMTRLGLSARVGDAVAASRFAHGRLGAAFRSAIAERRVRIVALSPDGEAFHVRMGPGPRIGTRRTVTLETEPLRAASWDAAALTEAYGLTPREALVALHLLRGGTTATASEEMALTRETLRTYLRTIYSKTSTGSQSQLVALLCGADDAASRTV